MAVGYVNSDVKGVRLRLTNTGIDIRLLKVVDGSQSHDISLSEDMVDHLINNGQEIFVCAGDDKIQKVVSTFELDRDDLLRKQGAYRLMKEIY